MKLEQLVHVVEVANTQSISKAAANLLMTQPGLSLSVKQLECELGTELFVRNNKGVELTEAGNSFVVRAKKILQEIDSLEKVCKDGAYRVSQTLSIAAGHYRFIGILTAMMLNRHKDDGSSFVVRNGIPHDVIHWVANGVCDVGVVHFRSEEEKDFKALIKQKNLQYHALYQTELKVIIGAGHPLYDTDIQEIEPEELAKYPLVSQDKTAAKDYFRSVFLYEANHDLRVIATDQAAVYEILEYSDGYCYGFSSEYMYRNLPRQHKTRELKVKWKGVPYGMTMGWIAPANMEVMPLVGEFVELVTDVCTCDNFWERHPDLKR